MATRVKAVEGKQTVSETIPEGVIMDDVFNCTISNNYVRFFTNDLFKIVDAIVIQGVYHDKEYTKAGLRITKGRIDDSTLEFIACGRHFDMFISELFKEKRTASGECVKCSGSLIDYILKVKDKYCSDERYINNANVNKSFYLLKAIVEKIKDNIFTAINIGFKKDSTSTKEDGCVFILNFQDDDKIPDTNLNESLFINS